MGNEQNAFDPGFNPTINPFKIGGTDNAQVKPTTDPNQFSFAEHVYHTTNDVVSPNTISPGLLNRFDREMNKSWWEDRDKQDGVSPPIPPEPPLEDPAFDPIDVIGAGARAGKFVQRIGRMGWAAAKGLGKEWLEDKNKEKQKE